VSVAVDVVELSCHDPELGWWASSRVRGRVHPDSTAGASAVTVPRLVFREAIEFAQLDPSEQCTVIVRDGESLQAGTSAIMAAKSQPVMLAPPRLDEHRAVERGVSVPASTGGDEVFITTGQSMLAAPAMALERFAGRGIERIDVHTAGAVTYLAGSTSEVDPDARVCLIVSARRCA
jgi:hypothetical protein